jgi:hypothetical protein
MLLRAAYHGLATAHAVLGQHDQATEAPRKSGLGAAPADTQVMFGGFWATAADGFRFTSPRLLCPEPGIQVAQGYDWARQGGDRTRPAAARPSGRRIE